MVTFLVTGYLTVPGQTTGGTTLLNSPTYVIAFEDSGVGGDYDYNDLVLEVSGVAVPDGGSTMALLGAAFVGLGMLRRKLA
jgi:VPDSG-CTERM motif